MTKVYYRYRFCHLFHIKRSSLDRLKNERKKTKYDILYIVEKFNWVDINKWGTMVIQRSPMIIHYIH